MSGFRIRFLRATDAARIGRVLAQAEPLWTTDTKKLYIGDGQTLGGVAVTGGAAGGGSVNWSDILGKPLSFPPDAHAASHGAASTDPIVIAQSQVTGLTAALAAKIAATEKASANGVATLGSDGKIPTAQLPALAITDTFVVGSQSAMLALTAERGDVAVRTDLTKSFILVAEPASTLGNWQELLSAGTSSVLSVNGFTGAVTLTAVDVGAAPSSHVGAGGAAHANATTSTAGFMSAADKTKLDGLSPGSGALAAFYAAFTNAAEVAVSTSVTATLGRMHAVTASSALTITLPAAAGNAGAIVGFIIDDTTTARVTIDGNASETIDGQLTLQMHKGGVLLLLCTGAKWRSLARNLAPNVNVSASEGSTQSLTANVTNIRYTTETEDTHNAWATDTFTAPVDGVYLVVWTTSASIGSASAFIPTAYKNGSSVRTGVYQQINNNYSQGESFSIRLAGGDTLQLRIGFPATLNRTNSPLQNQLSITRISD